MATEIRELDAGDWDEWYGGLARAFGGPREAPEQRALDRALCEIDRSLAAWDGGQVVGSATAFSFRMTLPGGAPVPTAGVSMVHVAATHRRRGVLRALMRRQLDDLRARGDEPLAALTASEPPIYGRFGYGLASRMLSVEADTVRAGLRVPSAAGEVRLRAVADPADALAACEEVYARQVPCRAGMLQRRPGWERLGLQDPPGDRQGGSPLRCVLAEGDGGEVRGYARYAVALHHDDRGAHDGRVRLDEVEALDPAAYAALWRFLFDIDLTVTLTARNRPVDDPWLHLVEDWRMCRLRFRDALFVRPVDVGRALAARTYSADVDVVLDVADDFCPWNAGRWRLSGDTGGATCGRTREPAELSLSVRELGAALLGGETLAALAGAGRVRELREGALAAASRAFATDLAPWLPHSF